ncbi:MAG TPA: DUF4870 domain-containing protein [Bryobacteraceae bacterium]|nr:DUF4870 domain-containing protein [Bryobacteraceae bacterium]
MAFCPNCGAQVEGNFCGNCGATMGAGPAPGAGPQYQQQQQYQQPQAAGMTNNMAAALCYLAGFITGIIFLVIQPYNTDPKIKYHAWQSIGFNVAMIAIMVLFSILTALTGGILALVLAPLSLVIWLGAMVLWIILMVKAYQGEGLNLPVIGDFAKKQAGL